MKLYRVQDDPLYQSELWGKPVTQVKPLPRSIQTMYRLYGKVSNQQCGNCKHFFVKEYAGKYFKCDLQKNTNGPGTDWRKRWTACGKFEDKT